jgi:hypothetical protein
MWAVATKAEGILAMAEDLVVAEVAAYGIRHILDRTSRQRILLATFYDLCSNG